MGYTDLGNNQGLIYAVSKGNIHIVENNTKEGLRLMKSIGLQSRALGLGQRGTFTITIGTITGSGTLNQVNVDAVNQIASSINYDVGEEEDLAVAIRDAINSHTPSGGPDYSAVAFGNLVVGYAPDGLNPVINGDVVSVSTTGDITITTTDVEGVPDQSEIYSTTHGYQIFVDSGINAPLDDYSGADDVTKFVVPQTLDGALPSKTITLASDKATAERTGAVSFIRMECQTGNSDDCIGINPVGYADNDLVYVSGFDEDNAVTFKEDANGNFVLKDSESYLSIGVGTWMLLQHIGGTFYELIRASSSQGLIGMTYGQGAAAISAGTLVPGTQYLITDRGHRGLVLTAVANNRFSLEGKFIAAVPDYQNTTGNFIGDWRSGLTPSVNQIVAYADGTQYVNITGTNTATNPASDTTNWTALDRSTSTDYVVEVHDVEFDYDNDIVVKRSDSRGNSVTIGAYARSIAFGLLITDDGNLDFFYWGNDNVTGNKLWNAVIDRKNFYVTGTMNSSLFENCWISANASTPKEIAKLNNARFVTAGFSDSGSGYAPIEFDGSVDAESLILNAILGSSVRIDFNGGSVTNLSINAAGDITIDGDISGCYLDLHQRSNFASGSFTLGESMNGKRLLGGFSSGETDRVITGLTEIDFDLCIEGIINLTSTNATETISAVDNFGMYVEYFRLKPEAGLAVTLEGADPASPADTEILIPPLYWDDVSPGAFGALTLDGDNGDYCEIRIVIVNASITYAIVEKVVQF